MRDQSFFSVFGVTGLKKSVLKVRVVGMYRDVVCRYVPSCGAERPLALQAAPQALPLQHAVH